ncbi:MAG TPA: chromate transporter [Candidatus Eisenbacteria bacterium]|nr:chromate transporter [Candidatus Eisenbacteria bacterium]
MNKENHYSLRELVLYALKLGTTGFGGPVALVGYMYRDLVERRRWISDADYREGLTLAQIAPGPLAAQLAIYLGYVDYRIVGATLVGLAFVLPSFIMVVALGWLYRLYGGLSWMQAVFYGIGAAVIGIITLSAYKLTLKTIGKRKLLWAIYLVSAASTAVTESEFFLIILFGGVLVWFVENPPFKFKALNSFTLFVFPAVIAGSQMTPRGALLLNMSVFFAKAGSLVFGSGLAIIPALHGGAVNEYHWLTERQFLDAVAVAMITPGPVVITVGFIGFLVAGFAGACVAAAGTFLPCYLFTVIPAPYFKKYGKRPAVISFVDGVTAAAVGAITGAVVVLGRRSLTDIPTIAIAVATGFILWKTKKIPEPVLILLAAIIGLALKWRFL